jgi:Glycine zipper
MPSTPFSLHKCWSSHTHADISLQREQKYLLHNRRNCRYSNRAQIARPVLDVGLTGCNCHERRIVAADAHRDAQCFIVIAGEELTPRTRSQLIANECHGHFNFVTAMSTLSSEYLFSESKILRSPPFMPDHPKPEKKSTPSSKNLQVPPIPKQTAGAVTGAAIGSIAGPTGAVVGGVIGALVGKAAADGRPVRKAVRRARAVSKSAPKRHPVKKSLPKSRKASGRRLRAKTAKRTGARRSPATRSHKRTVRASDRSIRSRQRSTLSRARQKRTSGRAKRR